MNKKVIKRMMNTDLRVRIPGIKDALGDTLYVDYYYKCYKQELLTIVTNALGQEVTSSTQIYVEGTTGIQIPSNALLTLGKLLEQEEENATTFVPSCTDRIIIRREIFYAPKDIPDLGVFYLP